MPALRREGRHLQRVDFFLSLFMLIETAGATFRLDGEKVLVRYPDEEQREQLAEQVALLRAHRPEVAAFLKVRSFIPTMPGPVRLLESKLKEPPVAIETCSVVADTALFVRSTLEQLGTALAQPKRWVGWSVPQLIDRLAQVGVIVTLESEAPEEISITPQDD